MTDFLASLLLRPPVFLGFLCALMLASLALAFSVTRGQRRLLSEKEREIARYREEIVQCKADLERLHKELTLAVQMHEGLKGQYDELEQQFYNQFEKSSKTPPAV